MAELAALRPRVPAVRIFLARSLTHGGIAVGIAAAGAVGGLGFANGGYFPVSWGWAALGLFGLVGIALAVGVSVELGVLDRLFLVGLTGFAGWIALSLLWTGSVPRTVLESERMVVYLAAAAAGVVLLRKSSVAMLVVGVWFAIAVVSTYGLATRLFPDQLGSFDPIATYRLWDPVGYWNAFGIFAGIGTLLALGLAARSGPVVRCFASASTVVFMLVLYFTYSRGSWIAFFVGLGVAVAVDRRRLQLITAGFFLAPWAVAAIWVASTSPALTKQGSNVAAATSDGHGLAVIAIGLMVGAGLSVLAFDWLETALSVPDRVRRVYAGTLLFVLAAVLIAVFGQYGLPPTLAQKAYDAFTSTPSTSSTDLNDRLFSFTSNGRNDLFRAAWDQAEDHRLLGGGAGTFDEYWFQHRPVPATSHDAHSLYLETLGELGPPGLVLLALALAVPLLAVRRARSSPLAAVAYAGYAAYLLHAAADWDWEMPTVTLVALFCGVAVLAAARRDREPHALRLGIRLPALGLVTALFGFALLGLLGNSAVSASSKATAAGNYAEAQEHARNAIDYAPWASQPWRKLGEAQYLADDVAGARASFREAIAKDPHDWLLWYELAYVSKSAERTRAFAEASRLNPLDARLTPKS